jgi:ubiquinone/menaquinone biosynthesis C-methylase UbiE
MKKKEYFDQMAASWDARFYTPDLFERLENLVAQFEIQKRTKILDVGTGTGGLIPLLYQYIGKEGFIIAIDFSKGMIREAKAKFKGRGNIKYSISSVESLPFMTGFFDCVICFAAFPHFEDRLKALSEMHRVLKEKGKLFIAHALSSVELKDHHKGSLPVAYDVLPEEAEMKRMMREAGFGDVFIIDKEKCYLCRGIKH